MSNEKYPQKPGTGTLFEKRSTNSAAPKFKGFLQLPDGRVVGIAAWVKQTRNGELLSLSVDQKETDYQAAQLKLPAYQGGAAPAQNRGGEPRDSDRYSQREHAGFGRGRQQEREQDQRSFGDDMEDEIPF